MKPRLMDQSFGSLQPEGMPGSRMGGHGIMKPPVMIGIYERNGRVFTELFQGRTAAMLQSFIHGKISVELMYQAETWRNYDGLVDLGCDKYYSISKGGVLLQNVPATVESKPSGVLPNSGLASLKA